MFIFRRTPYLFMPYVLFLDPTCPLTSALGDFARSETNAFGVQFKGLCGIRDVYARTFDGFDVATSAAPSGPFIFPHQPCGV